MALLEAWEIRKAYRTRTGSLQVLDGTSLEVEAGELVALVGASGSGKSTLARVLAGLEAADAGRLCFQDAQCDAATRPAGRPRAFREAQLDMQMVFQHPAASFSPRMKLERAVAEGIAYKGEPRRERPARVAEALDAVGLPRSYAGKYAWELSGGECQRAAIARAIIGDPVLLLADEPTSALDVTVQAKVVHLLSDICRERGMACLFVSHDLALVRGLCSRIYVMDAGRIVEEGDVGEVLARPASDAARRLVTSIVEL